MIWTLRFILLKFSNRWDKLFREIAHQRLEGGIIMTVNVKFVSEVTAKEGKTLLKASKDTRVKLKDSCDGDGKCGKCQIKVISGKLSEPTKEGMKTLGLKKIEKGYRLACQAEVIEGEVIVEVIED